LPEDHLAWFVLASVEDMDLSAFYASYRPDGHGRAAHDPAMMVALLLYAYSMGQRSSRVIERECVEDIAYRVIAANRKPDHATLARFVVRHEAAVAGLFGEVLSLCADAGMVKVGVVAIDGTKVHANASQHSNRDYEQIAKEILAEAAETDRLEDELYGDKRGDELPPQLATGEGRRAWLRDARRRLDEKRAADPQPVPRSRPKRLKESKRRLEEELWTESRANEAYEAYRARGRMKDGRRFGGPPKAYQPPETPAGKVNVTDPDSRNVKTPRGYMQGVTEKPEIVVADAGYWHQKQMENVIDKGIQVLIPPDAGKRKDTRPGWQGGQYSWMRYVLATDHGHGLYRRRQGMIEPVFANTKFNRRIDRFRRRGRGAVRSEWRLITATHNLLKLHKHQIALAGA
jgi:transposase